MIPKKSLRLFYPQRWSVRLAALIAISLTFHQATRAEAKASLDITVMRADGSSSAWREAIRALHRFIPVTP
jgi:hypothetical protein